MRRIVLVLACAAALSSCIASAPVSRPSTVRDASIEEMAIVEAALADPRLVEAWGMKTDPVVIDRTDYDRPDDSDLDNAFYSFTRSQTLTIATPLPALLNTEGRAKLSLRGLRVPPGFILASSTWFDGVFLRNPESGWQRFSRRYGATQRVVSISAPVIRADHALVAVCRWSAAPCCGDGYTIYLEKGPAGWAVVAYGHFWCA